MTKKQWFWRITLYAIGITILSFGVSLCAKAGYGISGVTSLPYGISNAFHLNFSRTVLVTYIIMVGLQFVVRGKNRQWRDLFQIPFSVVFSSFLEWFESLLTFPLDFLWQKLILLVIALLCMGIGVSLTVNPNFVPNPPDGLTQALSVRFHISMGLTKNLMDFTCVGLTVLIDLLFIGRLFSVGFGTVCCMIFIGRIIAVFDHFCKAKMLEMMGLAPKEEAKA